MAYMPLKDVKMYLDDSKMVKIHDLSQPWGVVSDVLMGFYCDVTGDTTVTLDGELASAIWMDRSEIKGQPDDMSLTNEMMMVFRDGKEPK